MPKPHVKIRDHEQMRAKVKVSNLINLLHAFIFDIPIKVNAHEAKVPEISPVKMKGLLALLDKCLPNLSTVELTLDEETTQFVIGAKPYMTPEEWQKEWKEQTLSLSGPHNQDHKQH